MDKAEKLLHKILRTCIPPNKSPVASRSKVRNVLQAIVSFALPHQACKVLQQFCHIQRQMDDFVFDHNIFGIKNIRVANGRIKVFTEFVQRRMGGVNQNRPH